LLLLRDRVQSGDELPDAVRIERNPLAGLVYEAQQSRVGEVRRVLVMDEIPDLADVVAGKNRSAPSSRPLGRFGLLAGYGSGHARRREVGHVLVLRLLAQLVG